MSVADAISHLAHARGALHEARRGMHDAGSYDTACTALRLVDEAFDAATILLRGHAAPAAADPQDGESIKVHP